MSIQQTPSWRGLLHSVWSLVTPLAFTPATPTVSGERYRLTHGRGIAPLADVYLPEGPGPHPSVILVHGGGFLIGSRAMKPMKYLATRLREAGFAVLTIDYRMIFRGGRLPEMVDDVRNALDWWSHQSDRFQLDPQRVSVLGLSAGATLSLLAAESWTGPSLHRLISVFGVYRFDCMGHGPHATLWRRWLLRTTDPAVWRRRSVHGNCRTPVPILMLHGTEDQLVALAHAEDLAASRREAGLPVELLTFAGAPHAFFNDLSLPYAHEACEAIIAHLTGERVLLPVAQSVS